MTYFLQFTLILKFYVVKKPMIFQMSSMYPVSYAFVVAFNSDLKLEKIFVVRSFNDSFDQFNGVGYLSSEILQYFDPITARQRRECEESVFIKKEKFSLGEMFSCELKFVIDILKKWLIEKIFQRFDELDMLSKQSFKRENLIN